MISHSKKFVFVHIPKTAGTSITDVLNSYCEVKSNDDVNSPFYYHASAIQIKNFFNKMNWDLNDYFKFTFVRNPWDRLVSYYEFTKKRYKKLQQAGLLSTDMLCKKFGEEVNSFTQFIEYLDKYAPNSDSYYHSINNNPQLDFVGKLDTLQSDFNHICKMINIPITKLPHLQSTKRLHYSEYYDEHTKKIVEDKFSDDISMFGHIFSKESFSDKKYKSGFLKYNFKKIKNEQKQMRFNAYNGRKSNS